MAEIDINDDDWIVDLESNIVRHKTALHEGLEIKLTFHLENRLPGLSITTPWSPKKPHNQEQDILNSARRAFLKAGREFQK